MGKSLNNNRLEKNKLQHIITDHYFVLVDVVFIYHRYRFAKWGIVLDAVIVPFQRHP